jgi:hypothetical protein
VRGWLVGVVLLTLVIAPAGASGAMGGWFPPPPDLSVTGQNAADEHVAVAADGTTSVVWDQSNGVNQVINVATRTAGTLGWSSPLALSAPGADAGGPQVATAPGGATIVVWARFNGATWTAQAASRAAGASGWSGPVNVSNGADDALNPQVVVAADGTSTVIWIGVNGASRVVEAATRRRGSAAWSAPVTLSPPGHDAADARLAAAADGSVTVVWDRSDGANTLIGVATRPAGAVTWRPAVTISTPGADALFPQVAAAPDGSTTVVWQRFDGANEVIEAATRPAKTTTWSAPTTLSATGQNAGNPQVSVAAAGATIVAWQRFDAANDVIQAAARGTSTAAWSAPVTLSASGENAINPQLHAAPDGATTVVWDRSNGTNQIIQATTRIPSAAAWSPPNDLSAAGEDAVTPHVAVAPDGTATAVWLRSDGTSMIVQADSTAVAPASRTPPLISGAVQAGRTLTCRPGASTNATTISTQWLRDGRPLPGRTRPRYTLVAADAGHVIECRVALTGIFAVISVDSAPVVVPALRCVAPRLVGFTLRQARAVLRGAHCRLGSVVASRSSRPRGRIVSQAIPPGWASGAGARISITISRGQH